MMRSHMAASSITGRLSSVSTPPGSTLLQIPCGARRFATFFVYERMPPLLAAYSGNSEPVCPLAEPTLTTERIHGAGFDSLVNTKEELAAICQAIEAAGTTDSAAVNEALTNLQYEGVTGAIHYEGSGDPVKDVKFVTVKDGAYALVENGAEEAPAEEPASEEASEEAAA